jgi:hypothetical protein
MVEGASKRDVLILTTIRYLLIFQIVEGLKYAKYVDCCAWTRILETSKNDHLMFLALTLRLIRSAK